MFCGCDKKQIPRCARNDGACVIPRSVATKHLLSMLDAGSAHAVTFAQRLVAEWYAPRLTALTAALTPLALAFRAVATTRRALYEHGMLRRDRVRAPVVVVGNIAVGGTGKTPLVIALARALAARGWHPGLVSRGHGGDGASVRAVSADANPDEVGDEALLLARSGFPLWIGVDRAAAARALLAVHEDCDVLICDDGLQHYALARDVEIAVIDASRGVGNGRALPAGPLREPESRLTEVDAVVIHGPAAVARGPRQFTMRLVGDRFVLLGAPDVIEGPAAFRRPGVHAVAGIGNPRRFFDDLRAMGIDATCHAFPDHHRYSARDLEFAGASAVLMTEKDAVKCERFADARFWSRPVDATIEPALIARVEEKLRGSQTARAARMSGDQGATGL